LVAQSILQSIFFSSTAVAAGLPVESILSIAARLSFAKTSSAFNFNNLGKPDITCSNSQYENYAVWCSFAIWQSYTSKINKI
jgi:hypothetical protein